MPLSLVVSAFWQKMTLIMLLMTLISADAEADAGSE